MSNLHDSKIALIYGGWSSEREVSLQSGSECAKALGEAGFTKVDILDMAEDGFVTKLAEGGYDVAFVALHGKYGEDGCIQGLLELLGIPYTFSGVCASAVASDKAMTKDIYREHGIPTPEGVCLLKSDYPAEAETEKISKATDELLNDLGLPMFVKPVANGSSFGVTRVDSREGVDKAIRDAFELDTRILVETAISGTEITLPVLGNEHPQALPAVEIRYDSDFYDLAVKYDDPTKHHVIPPELPAEIIEHANELACRAHVALGCAGASRSDFIITKDGTPYMLETNIIPGMTASSLLPDAARRAGIEFPQLCEQLVALALERPVRTNA